MIAVLVAAVGAIATVGFEPVISLARFEYTTLALSLAGALMIVYRLGAGLHGLGTRGILTVIVGSLLLAVTLAYAELLRRYGTPGLVEWLFDGVRWSRTELGAFPRPIEARARHPGPRLGLPHAGPAPAGLVGVRLRRRGHRAGREQRPQHHDHPHRVRARGAVRRWWSASWSASC